MKYLTTIKFFMLISILFLSFQSKAQNSENWSSKQLIDPSELSSVIKAGKKIPVIFSVGPAATIPNSIDIGIVKDEANLNKFKKRLNGIQKNRKIVVYCGCCPYEHCPNVRPAINALKQMKFTNYYLLDLPNNIKKDWIDKGYPTTN